MRDIEELYDSNESATDRGVTVTTETISTVDPLSRIPAEIEDCETSDDVISVEIDTH